MSKLTYRLNKCGVISPRYDVNHGEIEAWVARLLPSRLVSTETIGEHCISNNVVHML